MSSGISSPRTAPAEQAWPMAGLLTLSAAVFLAVTTEFLPVGLLTEMSRDLDVSESKLGLLITGYAFVVGATAAPLTGMTSRWPRRRLLLVVLGVFTLSNVIMAMATVYPLAMTARLVGGVAHGVFFSLVAGYASRMVSPERMGRALAIAMTGNSLALVGGIPLGTALGSAVGWRGTYVVVSIAAVILLFLAWRVLPEFPGAERGTAVPIRKVVRIPGVALISGATLVFMLGHFFLYTYITPFLTDRTGVDDSMVSPILLGYGAAGLLGMWLTGIVIDRRPRALLFTAAGSLTAVLLFLGIFGAVTGAAVPVVMIWGAFFTAMPVALQTAMLRFAPSAPDAATGVMTASFNIGIGSGALLGGFALDGLGIRYLPYIAAALAVIGLFGMVKARPYRGTVLLAKSTEIPAKVPHH